MIIALSADKGGVGKSSLAYELAYVMNAILIDLDWSGGGVTKYWGYDPRAHRHAPLLDALAQQSVLPPKVLHADGRPDLVPSHPDWGASVIEPETLAKRLAGWARIWDRPVVLDTHPGFGEKTEGALMSADVVAVPVPLRTRELDALEEMLDELRDFNVVVCPNMVPKYPPLTHLERLRSIVGRNRTAVAPPVSEHRFWGRRQMRAALTSLEKPGKSAGRAVAELTALAEFLQESAK